jgi:hypothetical protein
MMRAPLAAPSLVLVVLLTGCAELLPSSDTAGLPEYGGAAATTAPPASPKAVDATQVDASVARADTLVRAVSLTAADVSSGGRRLDAEAGAVADDATLSGVCGRELRSDGHRVARRAVQVVDDGDRSGTYLGVEVVAYESETWAERAIAEWRDAIATCPIGEDFDVLGVLVRYYSASERRDARLPVGDNSVTTSVTGAEATGGRTTAYQILQRRGAVVSVVEVAADPKPSAAAKAEALRLAKLVGRRQAKLRA